MVGGQLLDLEAEGNAIDESSLENIHQRKTGELIKAAIMMPSELTNTSEKVKRTLNKFANSIGLIFQIMDDLLEAEQDTSTLGKNTQSDIRKNKSTYPSLLGVKEARNRANKLYEYAMDSLTLLGERTAGLRWIASYVIERAH
jgi:geranylgeranyl pyrophosphate synthase